MADNNPTKGTCIRTLIPRKTNQTHQNGTFPPWGNNGTQNRTAQKIKRQNWRGQKGTLTKHTLKPKPNPGGDTTSRGGRPPKGPGFTENAAFRKEAPPNRQKLGAPQRVYRRA